ncbi:MarR family transcriptional regulator [Sulfuracidifex metallicus]|uniref:MarR family transcriptional regulator n=1 Tax=Sulfuracidifex metallicus DSM 6482 = JCM 9184 TaxID=523847 RepID=A0A6A9QKY0_SULME|nr:helix-turn-helix domain-containing protein [Sulfuracidifex metallicus]MUN29656.1 MarR family transcriptional regulator [Sulfuracidifex metallicus DSM 6482 = JCM 9184]WOE49837.1 helix-turn-helix domain-containing protein [Sulfuracidifex metallicus DSM 6482 = JCM 9184]
MDVTELTVLTLLSEGELSVKEIRRYSGMRRSSLLRALKSLEDKGLVEKKVLIGDDIVLGITDQGMEELYKYYLYLRDLVNNMEQTVCLRFNC